MKKSIIKDITLVIIGMLLVGVPVMAVSYIPSKEVSYKTDYNENVTNVEEALDILTNQLKELNNTGDSSSSDILSGKTAYVNGKLLTGSMANYSGVTKSGNNITESGSNALIKIPAGYYDEDSSISIPIDTIEQLPTVSSDLTVFDVDSFAIWVVSNGGASSYYNIPCKEYKSVTIVSTNYNASPVTVSGRSSMKTSATALATFSSNTTKKLDISNYNYLYIGGTPSVLGHCTLTLNFSR